MKSFSAPSKILTPPWVEQYLYHLSRSIRKAEDGAFRQSYHYHQETREQWNLKYARLTHLVNLRKIQHKMMKEGLYQVGYPLWEKVK